ncbi:hypothetical protein [Blastococcus sp. URHD0036]|uniref:hypothetical protein n=1 Tax=Blastococcus sp. URHD0036 TaxID=1380356 RepID=UPI00068EEA14|nr:hypothetical protein [Blastococcus sp. URHD0036]
MIARYFGSKAALYLASIRRYQADVVPRDVADPEVVRHLLERVALRGLTPTLDAAVRPHEDANCRQRPSRCSTEP